VIRQAHSITTAIPSGGREHTLIILRYLISLYLFVCEAIMRILSTMAVAIASAWMGAHANAAAAQSFEDRWSIVPKAHAEQTPQADRRIEPAPPTQAPTENLAQQPQFSIAAEPARGSKGRPGVRISKRSFSGKASFYSYQTGKTASGSSFDRNLPTAAHRSLPFGTRVRVTNLGNQKSVTVTITDRGPKASGRVLDLSLGAARILGMTNRGVAEVHAELL
jgi:rare lipoprotein A (peptidoglycan hydrolase)